MVDGKDYGLFKPLDPDVFAPAKVGSGELKGSFGRTRTSLDDIHAEIDRIMAERRVMAENTSGGKATASVTMPRDPADHTSFSTEKAGVPSLRERALDAMAKHEQMVEQSRAGIRNVTGVPKGTVQEAPKGGGNAGKPYNAIRDDMIKINNKPDSLVPQPVKATTPEAGAAGPNAGGREGTKPAPSMHEAQGVEASGSAAVEPLLVSSRALETQTYTRKLTITEIRNGFEGTVHERRELLAARGSGRDFDLAFASPTKGGTEATSSTAEAAPEVTGGAPKVAEEALQLTKEEKQSLIDQRLDELDQIEGTLFREWEKRFGASPPPEHRLPSTEVTGRPAIEAELKQAVDLRRFQLTGERAAVKGLPEGVDIHSAIRQAEAVLLGKTVGIDRQAMQRELSLAQEDMARATQDAFDAQNKARSATALLRGDPDPPVEAAPAPSESDVFGPRASVTRILDPQETTLLREVAKGRSSSAIARDLDLPVRTVDGVVNHAVAKLEAGGSPRLGFARPQVAPITAREAGILRDVAGGRSIDTIAGGLKLPPKGVEFLLGRILKRFESPSSTPKPLPGNNAGSPATGGTGVEPGTVAPVGSEAEAVTAPPGRTGAEHTRRNPTSELRCSISAISPTRRTRIPCGCTTCARRWRRRRRPRNPAGL